MAPNAESRPRRISMEGLQRAFSDLSFQITKVDPSSSETAGGALPAISEVEDAACECCGMSEECTPEYILRVQDKFLGRWICGLCAEAVKEETVKNGGRKREALEAHMSMCARFSRIGRTHPELLQADAVREILRKTSRARAQSTSPRDRETGGVAPAARRSSISRTASCIPAITKEMNKTSKQFIN